MARKGSRQKNGLDRNSSKEKQAVTEPMNAPFSDKRNNSNVHDRKMVDRELPTAYPHRRSTSSGEMVNNTNYVGDGDGTKQSYDDISCGAKSGNRTSNISQSVDMSSQVRDAARSDLLSNASELRTDDQILYRSTNNVSHTVSNMSEGVPVKNVMRDSGPTNAVMGRSFRSFSLHALEMAKGWFEQQQPYFKVFATIMKDAHSYVRLKIEHVYPIISTWILQFGKLMFVLSMVWLECNIRGLDSLLRLGTTSFLTVLSCSILSVTAMIGFTKMVIIMVIAALLVVFAGFAFASLIVAIFAIIILWFYGSFWTSGLVIVLGGSALVLRHERVALLITTLYSMHCARSYVGWLGLLLGLNMAFILSDILVHILKTSVNESRPNIHPEQARQSQGSAGHFSGEPLHSSPVDDAGRSSDRSQGVPSTSGAETELTSEEEVVRLLNCSDHYSALGLNRFQSIDISYIKKEYRKKAMLVHPDKNMGNEKAVEAFKKLQNAYEVLLDSLKRKTYDDELRREELFSFIRRFQSGAKKNGRYGSFGSGFSHSTEEGSMGESRRIACKKCSDFHIWTRTERSKSRARWCQDCNDFHQAKDGDGWVEQSSQPLLFGLLQKMDPPHVYVCAESRIYDATEWFICQGMRCPPNSHKPSFHVNTSVTSKHSSAKASSSSHRGGAAPTAAEAKESMTEEEFFEWLQNAMQFEASSVSSESPAPRNSSSSSSSKGAPKKRKGKKQR